MSERKFKDLEGNSNFLKEIWGLISTTKKYWLVPVILILLGLGLLIWAGGTAAAPFIYTLF